MRHPEVKKILLSEYPMSYEFPAIVEIEHKNKPIEIQLIHTNNSSQWILVPKNRKLINKVLKNKYKKWLNT